MEKEIKINNVMMEIPIIQMDVKMTVQLIHKIFSDAQMLLVKDLNAKNLILVETEKKKKNIFNNVMMEILILVMDALIVLLIMDINAIKML